jgi:hypothetical protein
MTEVTSLPTPYDAARVATFLAGAPFGTDR